MPAIYRVYVLQNPEGRFYIGLSDNVDRRRNEHDAGVAKWTRRKRPWKLAWQSNEMTLSDARKLENRLKRQGRGKGFYTITGLPRRDGS
jgi:putative endonuclease